MSFEARKSKPASFAALIFVLALPLTGCDDSTGPNEFVAEESFSYVLDATGKVRLNVEAGNGSITITGIPLGDELRVEGIKQVWARTQVDADEYLDSLEVYADEQLDEFLVSTDQPDEGGGRTYVVDYEIEVPDGLAVVIASGNTEIRVAAMNGDIVIASGNGDITLDEIEASVVAALGNGDIEAVVTLPLGGNLDLAVGNGPINLAIPQSTSAGFSAEVGNGTISLVNLTLGNEVTTPTTRTGTLGGGQGSIELAAGNGSITVTGL